MQAFNNAMQLDTAILIKINSNVKSINNILIHYKNQMDQKSTAFHIYK